MKYINIKRYKFSTILKNFNTLGNNLLRTLGNSLLTLGNNLLRTLGNSLLTLGNNLLTLGNNFLRIFKFINPIKYNLNKINKYLNIRSFNFIKITKFINPKTYNINRLRKIKFINYKFLLYHIPTSIIFFGLLYLTIPSFYHYDKSSIEKAICKNKNIECLIRGEVNYSFYPTPRIKIKNLIVKDSLEKKNTIIKVEHVAIKLSIKNLLAKEKHRFKKIQLNNYEINFNLKNLKKYKNIFREKITLVPIFFTKGQVIFFDGKEYVATINDANINIKFIENSIDSILKGKFLDDDIYINLNRKKVDSKLFTDIILKMSDMNFLVKANVINSAKNKNTTNGNILIKKGKNRITAILSYKDNELIIKKSNLSNTFLDGKLEGKITLLPYFDFDLDLNLSSINFTKAYNYFLSLDQNNQKNLFNINEKINGKLNLFSDKIYSSYNLAHSFESRIKFYNGNISIDQFLLNLGKLGAADILGTIHNDNAKKFTNFKFESNIFFDDKKKFLRKFGIHNKKNIPSNLFVAGNFDLKNIRISFYEILSGEKNNSEYINYIEKEFNDLVLEDGYGKLFHFPTFKEFIKSVVSENN